MAEDKQLLRELIVQYHQAFKRDFEAALSCMADSHFRPVGDPAIEAALGGWTEETVEGRLPSLKGEGASRGECHFLQIDRRNNLGLVVSRETANPGSASPGKVTHVWLAANIDGEWKITGGFFRDVKRLSEN